MGGQGRATQGGFWTPEREALVGTASDAVIAKKLGLKKARAGYRRTRLGIPPFTPRPAVVKWTPAMVRLLGKQSDTSFGARFGIRPETVGMERRRRGIKASSPEPVPRNRLVAAILRKPTSEASEILAIAPSTVYLLRRQMGVTPAPTRWTKRVLSRLGKKPDAKIAAEIGVLEKTVAAKRRRLGIIIRQPWRPWTP